jgi:hypothetical protein
MGDHEQRLEEILAECNLGEGYESINMSSISLPSANDTITISSSMTSPYTLTSGAIGTSFPNAVYTTSGIGSGGNVPWLTQNPFSAPKIKLDGEGADIEVNGWSLIKTLQEIQSRLNLLQPNTALEAEWDELYALGRKYRELEQQIKDKQATWDRLKAMPPPTIDQ